jgi:uncharacterized protein
MKTRSPIAWLIVSSLFLLPAAGAFAGGDNTKPDPLALMQMSHDASKVDDSQAKTVFRLISSNGKTRLQEAETVTRRSAEDGVTSRLARFLSPADVKGTAVLTAEQPGRDDDIWLFLPALGKVRRLQGNNTREAYMGTDLSYGDVIGHAPEEWKHTIIGEDVIDGAKCWIVQSEPMTKAVMTATGYSKRVNWVRSDNAVLVRAELYDRSGRLLKRIDQKEIVKVSSTPARWQAMKIEVENLRTHHRTEVVISDYKANLGLGADLFSPRALERAR